MFALNFCVFVPICVSLTLKSSACLFIRASLRSMLIGLGFYHPTSVSLLDVGIGVGNFAENFASIWHRLKCQL